MKNYQPRRGTSQTTTTGGDAFFCQFATSGDAALLAQNTKYEVLSQNFVGSISVIKNSEDITVKSQNVLLAINIQMTSDSALAYQPNATAKYWNNGITDWLATYNAQVAYASAQGW